MNQNSTLLSISQIGFAFLTVLYLWFLMRELKSGIEKTGWNQFAKKKYFNRILIGIITWILFVSIWSASGMMGEFERFPFNFAPVIAIPLIVVIASLFTKSLGEVLRNIPEEKIIRLQSFRFFVELLLWALFAASILPVQMTFEGRNFDVLSGITAPFIAWFVSRKRLSGAVVVLWNIICLALLINIVVIAIVSTPSPWRVFMNEPANTIVTTFPISWLPGFLVPLAYTLHFFSLKQLLMKKN